MLTKEKAHEIFSRLQKLSTADEIEALIYGGHSALTRFANNTIHQNVAEENTVISVRTAFGGRTARATTNKLDDDSLKRVVQSSENLAKIQHPDPDLLPILHTDNAEAAFRSNRRHHAGRPRRGRRENRRCREESQSHDSGHLLHSENRRGNL